MENFEQIVTFESAFDRRDPDPEKNYGVHGVTLRMVLKGPLGATQFLLYTNWHLPHVQKETDARVLNKTISGLDVSFLYRPMPADLGYHWRTPRYADHKSMGPCEFCDGGECYYDGSALQAECIFETLLREGSKGVWNKLRELYDELAKEEVTP